MEHSPTTAAPLTAREDQVLTYMIEFLRDHGYQPSVREIAEALNISSTKTVADVFRQLEEKGYIELLGFARGVRILGLQLVVTRTLVPIAVS